jgi:hypothetical protein
MPDLLHPESGPDEDESDEQSGLDDGRFVVAGTAQNQIEAQLLRAACDEAGIPTLLRAPRDSMMGKIDAPADSFELMVRTGDLERARAVIAEGKAALEADPEGAARAAEEEEAAGEAQAAAAAAKPG